MSLDLLSRAARAVPLAATLIFAGACDGGDDDGTTASGTTSAGTDATSGTSDGTSGTTSGTTTGATGSTGGSSSTGTPIYSHATDIQPIWTAACVSQCHDSACATPDACDPLTQNLDLVLDGDAYANLVDMMSVQNPSMVLVKPENPDASYLWHKIAGTHADVCMPDCGDQMPKGLDPLDAATQQMINDWIVGGALP